MRRHAILSPVLLLVLVAVTGCPDHGSAAPSAPASAPATPAPAPKAPLIPKPQIADWCKEHGVPESACTRCNPALVAEFKKKSDWCSQQNLPESQCIACHPEPD